MGSKQGSKRKSKKNLQSQAQSRKFESSEDYFESPYKFNSFHYDSKCRQPIYAIKFNPYILDRYIFAAVAKNRIYVYECVDHDEAKDKAKDEANSAEPNDDKLSGIKPLSAYKGGSDSFYALAWSYDAKKRSILAVGGEHGVVIVISGSGMKATLQSLRGHTGAINDMKFQPSNNFILLTAGADQTMRLWNMKSYICFAVFAGSAHVSQIISIDLEPDGKYVMAGGMDHVISIWSLESPDVKAAIAGSNSPEFSTIRVYDHVLTAHDLHSNYVDSVIWIEENSFISRSCDGEIIWWKSGSIPELERNLQSKTISKLLKVKDKDPENEKQWFLRMQVDNRGKYLAIANCYGNILLYDLESASSDGLKKAILSHPKSTSLLSMISFSHDSTRLVGASNDGKIFRFDKK